VNDNPNDGLERDPRLARLYEAASGEEPPAALDAAILAAARREVNARLQAADGGTHLKVAAALGGGGATPTPPVRAKRNWYVPVSIAAVMVLSVSLVMTLHQEKGDELSQPPRSASVPPAATAQAPAPAPAPAAERSPVPTEKADGALRDAVSATPKLAEEKRAGSGDAAKMADAKPSDGYAEPAKKQRAEKAESAAGSAAAQGGARKDQAANVAREQGPGDAAASRSAPGALGRLSSGVPAPATSASERRPEAFPAVREREAQVVAPVQTAPVSPVPSQPQSRDAAEARARGEADRAVAPRAAAPRRSAPAEDMQAQSAPAPAMAESRAAASPPPPAAVVMGKPAPPAQAKLAAPPRVLVWRGLEDQPPEKWLERLAEFKRDNRQADADELLAEFRRRFPDHPASAR